MTRDVTATINLAAIRYNARIVKQCAPHSRILAMVKSNAYGHGIVKVAKVLQAVDGFGVATINEAIDLRQAGIKKKIVLTQGITSAEELLLAQHHDLTIVIHHDYQLQLLQQLKQSIPCWLKIDTGMSRLGFTPPQYSNALEKIIKHSGCHSPVLMTHLANADEVGHKHNQRQLEVFKQLVLSSTLPKSACNSAAIIHYSDAHFDWVRPGIMLYGISPFVKRIGSDYGLRPVMTLAAKLIAIKSLHPGDYVGYGGTFGCQTDMRLGIVNIGYGDGYPRNASNGTSVLVNGIICPLVGRVSMDMLAIALPPQTVAVVGDPVILWGEGLSIERVALDSGTIAYELVNKLTQRVTMKYVDEQYCAG